MNTFFKGCLDRWYDARGFGFIRPDNGKGDVFIHISALKNMARRPIAGDIIYYQLHVDDNGKNKAINARIEGVAVVNAKKIPVNNQKNNQNKWIALLILLLFVVAAGFFLYSKIKPYQHNEPSGQSQFVTIGASNHDLILQDAFQRRVSNIQVEGEGTVSKLLPEDIEGSRHQKFIVRLNSGQTLLISHNIDIAPRIDSLREGDKITFNGEYEWSEKGGVVHWTHHDPSGKHIAGWLKHDGQTYQ